MTDDNPAPSYRSYWVTWSILLAMTLAMIFLDGAPLPRLLFVLIMVVAMLIKASLIGGYFMHLRFERRVMTVGVVVGLLVTAAILYGLIIPDAYRILGMSAE